MRRAVAAGALLAAAACAPRPPAGMVRLDSGGMNHDCAVDAGLRRLYCLSGKPPFATALAVVDLGTGRRRGFSFPKRRLLALRAPVREGTVTLAAETTRVDERLRPGAPPRRVLMTVDADTGRVLSEREGLDAVESGPSPRAEIVTDPEPGVKAFFSAPSGRVTRFFPTPGAPSAIALGPERGVYAAYPEKGGRWTVERLDGGTGARRPLTHFDGPVESLGAWAHGLILLRRETDGWGPRRLAFVEAETGWVNYELPWSDESSRILGVDGERHRLYVVMGEGEHQTCWAIPLERDALSAAADYLSGARARRPVTRAVIVAAWAMVFAILAVLTAALSGNVNVRRR